MQPVSVGLHQVVCRGLPSAIRIERGPKFISIVLTEWIGEHHVALDFIELGKTTKTPSWNALILPSESRRWVLPFQSVDGGT